MAVRAEDTVLILLAAGLSRRHPGDKLLAEYQGRPLIAHAAGTLAAIPFAARVAVIPPDAPGRAAPLAALGFETVVNPAPEDGQGASLRVGAAAAARKAPKAVVLALADMPHIPESHVRALLDRLDPDDPKSLAFSLAEGAERWRSPPAAFGAGWLTDLSDVSGDLGARGILRAAPDSAAVPAPAAWLADFDTPADFGGETAS